VRLIEPDDEGVCLSPLELPALRVYLDAPDGVILKQFKAALKEARKSHPAPIVKPGPPAHTAIFDRTTFDRWRENRIIQLGELLAWREELSAAERRNYPNVALGEMAGLEGGDLDKKTSLAIACLEKALSSVHALSAQICSDLKDGSSPSP
jgi:hypothetical protein